MRTIAQINHHPRQRFVHLQISATITADAFLATKRLAQAIAQHNAGVLDGVMNVDLDVANRHIQSLRGLGCKVCLDDFGAGAASFAYLQRLSVDVVKIDGRYVRDLASDGRDGALVRHLVQLCKELKVKTVAEMVETPEIEDAARRAGVDFAQGWLYGRPADRPEPAILREVAAPVVARRAGLKEQWG